MYKVAGNKRTIEKLRNEFNFIGTDKDVIDSLFCVVEEYNLKTKELKAMFQSGILEWE